MPLFLSNVTFGRALHSELLTELSSRFLSRDEFSRDETGSEGSDITVPTRSDPNFRKFSVKIRVGTSFCMSDITEIRKKSISETRENENFEKKMSNSGP